MSGLLPRTQETETQGSFLQLTVRNLTVNQKAYIYNLDVSNMTADNLTLESITCPTINAGGTSDLTLNSSAGNVNVTASSGDVTIQNSSGTLTAPTLTFGSPPRSDTLVTEQNSATLANKQLVDTTCYFVDESDTSKAIKFNAGGTAATATTIACAQTGNQTLTIPDVSGDFSPADTFAVLNHTQTLHNKALVDTSTSIVDLIDPTKVIRFNCAGTTGTATTLLSSQTTDRTLTLPDITDTIVTRTNTEALTNKSINALSNLITNLSHTTLTDIGVNTHPSIDTQLATLNSYVDQYLTTTSEPTFVSVTTNPGSSTGLTVNTTSVSSQPGIILNAPSGGIAYQNFNVGGFTRLTLSANSSLGVASISSNNTYPLVLMTSASERLRIPSAGIANNNADTNLLTLNGTTLEYRTVASLNIPSASALVDNTTFIVDSADATKKLGFDCIGTTATTTTLATSQTANRTLTLPDATDTIVGRATTDTLANKTLQAPLLTSISENAANTQFLTLNGSTIGYGNGQALYSGTATTTDAATLTTVITIPCGTSNKMYFFELWYLFTQTTTLAAGDGIRRQLVRNTAGVVTLVNALPTNAYQDAATTGVTTTLAVSGTNVVFQVTGLAGQTFKWDCLARLMISSN